MPIQAFTTLLAGHMVVTITVISVFIKLQMIHCFIPVGLVVWQEAQPQTWLA
jgi:hypothetical protein